MRIVEHVAQADIEARPFRQAAPRRRRVDELRAPIGDAPVGREAAHERQVHSAPRLNCAGGENGAIQPLVRPPWVCISTALRNMAPPRTRKHCRDLAS